MRSSALIAAIFTFFLLLILAISLLAFPETGFKGVGVIVIGPFPIIIDTSDPRHLLIAFIPFALMLLLFLTAFLRLGRRTRLRLE